MPDLRDLPLFGGAHIPDVRFEHALDRLDFEAALACCPPSEGANLTGLRAATTGKRPSVAGIAAARPRSSDPRVERAWQRVFGRALDGRSVPGVWEGEPAAAFLLRGGEVDRARTSILRHLDRAPADPEGWHVAAQVGVPHAAIRLAFHGGTPSTAIEPLVALAEEDGQEDPLRWVLPYAWLGHAAGIHDIAAALAAARLARPLPLPGDGTAFAWYLVEAHALRVETLELGQDVVEARRRLKTISPLAFTRYLARVA